MSETKRDLFLIARNNADQIEQRWNETCSNMEPTTIRDLSAFRSWFDKEARISFNLPLPVLATFSRTGLYLNVYGLARKQAKLSGRPFDDCLKKRLGEFYGHRMTFDNSFINGDRFVYAAVNTSGAGFRFKYGPLCAVFDADFPTEADDIAYIADDSLSCSFDETGNFLLNRLLELVAPHSHRDCLAALKLEQQVLASSPSSWHSLVLSDDSHIEVILGKSPEFSLITEVRMRRNHYDELWDLAFANFGRKSSDDAEKARILDFTYLIKESGKGRFRLEVCNDD